MVSRIVQVPNDPEEPYVTGDSSTDAFALFNHRQVSFSDNSASSMHTSPLSVVRNDAQLDCRALQWLRA